MERLLKLIHGGILAFLICGVAHAEVTHLGEAISQGYAEQAATHRLLMQQLQSEEQLKTESESGHMSSGWGAADPMEVRIVSKSDRKELKIARAHRK